MRLTKKHLKNQIQVLVKEPRNCGIFSKLKKNATNAFTSLEINQHWKRQLSNCNLFNDINIRAQLY